MNAAGSPAGDRGEYREAARGFRETLVPALGDPNSPVCRQDEVELFLGYGVHPAADSTSARKRESVFAVAVDNGEFDITVERSGIYRLPVHNGFHPPNDRERKQRDLRKAKVPLFSWFLGSVAVTLPLGLQL